MAKKRRIKRRKPTRRRTYKNPAKRRRRRNPSASRIKASLLGMNFRQALKNMPAYQLGMFATKWAVKVWGPEATLGSPDTWNWTSYLKGTAGAVGAGVLVNMLKPGWGQRVFEGGINYLFFQLIHNKIISQNAWAASHFGEEAYYPDEYLSGQATYVPGDVALNEAGQSYKLGADYQWYPTPVGVGDVLEPVGPLGDVLEPVGPLGTDDIYAKALLDN